MRPKDIDILDIVYRRPGLNKVIFSADYPGYTRRGVVVYDTIGRKFQTHRKDVSLLAAICLALQKGVSRNAR